jgi:hypothetical protein
MFPPRRAAGLWHYLERQALPACGECQFTGSMRATYMYRAMDDRQALKVLIRP